MKKKIICINAIIVILICCIGVVLWQVNIKKLTESDLKEYCMEHNVCHAKDFYIRKINNYYFAVSVGGDKNMSDELMIFQQCEKGRKEVDVFAGYVPTIEKERNSYSWYVSSFPNFDGYSIGNKMIIFSSNREKATKGVVYLKQNDEIIEKIYEISSEEPFILCIDKLGTVDNVTRDVIDMKFYDEFGHEIQEIVKAE